MNFVRSFPLPKPVPGCTYAVFRLAVPRSRAGQLDYNTTRAPLCQHLFSIFSTNFSPPFWALCILLSAARRTTRGGFFWAHGVWALIAAAHPHSVGRGLDPAVGFSFARNVSDYGNVPRAACRPPLRPMVNRAVRREHRPCRTALAAGSRPRPTNLRKIRTPHKTTIIRQSGEIHNNSKPKPQIASSLLYGSPWGPPGKLAKVLLAVWLPRAYTGRQNNTGTGIANDEDLPYKG